jgi:flagellar basal-body rod modification protein FlgD
MSQISSATSADNAVGAATKPNGFADLQSDDFIRIIFTELTNQDPLQPNDTGALLDQLNSIRSIESDLDLQKKLSSLVTENQLASASNMIGKFVGGRTQDLQDVTGYVVSALRQGDTVQLELDSGWVVPIENVQTIVDPSLFSYGTGQPSADAPAQDPTGTGG